MGRSILGGVPALAVLAALLLVPPAGATLAPGALDPSFGNGGITGRSAPAWAQYSGGGVDSQGRILAVGQYFDMTFLTLASWIPYVHRYLPDGAPDTTFGDHGLVSLGQNPYGFGGTGPVVAAVTPRDAVVLAAVAADGVFVSRVTPGGGVDPAFGAAGRARIGGSYLDRVLGVGAVPGGVLVAWSVKGGHARVTRLTDAGTLDVAYGEHGTAVIPALPDGEGRMAIAADGTTFVAGHAPESLVRPGAAGTAPAVVAIDHAGTPVTTFGRDGVSIGAAAQVADGSVSALRIAPDGGLWLVIDHEVRHVSAARFSDATHPPALALSARRDGTATALAVQPDGRILVGVTAQRPYFAPNPPMPVSHAPGVHYAVGLSAPEPPADDGLLTARYLPSGAIDCTYGTWGHARLVPDGAAADLVLDGENRALAFGWTGRTDSVEPDSLLLRSGAGTTGTPAPGIPAPVTGPLSDPVGNGALPAQATGWVDPRCGNVQAHFEYGPTTAYGAHTADVDVAGARGPIRISPALPLTNLGTYHYRLVASGPAGSSTGGDATFAIRAVPRLPRLVLGLSRADARRGRVAVLMRCRYAPCEAVLTLGRHGTVLGTGDAALDAGARARVPIRLNAAGRRRVAHHRVNAMTLTIAMPNARTITTPLTVRRPR